MSEGRVEEVGRVLRKEDSTCKGPGTAAGQMAEEGLSPRRTCGDERVWGSEYTAHKPGPAPGADGHVRELSMFESCSRPQHGDALG